MHLQYHCVCHHQGHFLSYLTVFQSIPPSSQHLYNSCMMKTLEILSQVTNNHLYNVTFVFVHIAPVDIYDFYNLIIYSLFPLFVA